MKNVIYKNILMTHDGSALASVAIPHALVISKNFNAKLFVLRVIETVNQELTTIDPIGMTSPIPAFGTNIVRVVKENKKNTEREMAKIQNKLETLGAKNIQTIILEGSPPKEILKFSKKHKIDLIVMSTHGRSGLGRIMLGSVTDYVVRNVHCPILVIRSGKTVEKI